MGLIQKLATILRAKASKTLDKAEDPRESLDYSYERQLQLLSQVRRGLADVATSRKRIELQGQQLQVSAAKLEAQARQALEQNREDLAREALTRRAGIGAQLTDLQAQHTQLDAEEQKLTAATRRLEAKAEAFRSRKETIKASYTAAEAQTKIGEAVAGISEEMGDVGMAMRRAEDKVAQMQARASAIDELLVSGALDDLSLPGDHIAAELARISTAATVDSDLARLKGELSAGAAGAASPALEIAEGRPDS